MSNGFLNIADYTECVDIDGDRAGVVIITTNRSGGKTTSMLNYSMDYYINTGRATCMVFRSKKESLSAAELYSETLCRRGGGHTVTQKCICDDIITCLYLDDSEDAFAYAVCLKDVDSIKKYSAVFYRVDALVLDEYQLEKHSYLDNEFDNMFSLLISVSRGGGYASRFVQLILLGNNYSLLNPYLVGYGISERYRKGMRRIRGKGVCAYFIQVDIAKNQMDNNLALKAYRGTDAMEYATKSDFWLADDSLFIDKPKGRMSYVCTLIYDGVSYGLWDILEDGRLYVSHKVISNWRYMFTLDSGGHGTGVRLMKKNNYVWKAIQQAYDDAAICFADIACKHVIMQFISKGLAKS